MYKLIIIIYFVIANAFSSTELDYECIFPKVLCTVYIPNSNLTTGQYERIANTFSKNKHLHLQFLSEYNSFKPVAVLVDNIESVSKDAASFMKNLLQTPSAKSINFSLMIFNTSGVSQVLETTQNNTDRFKQLLTKRFYSETSYLGPVKKLNGSLTFFAILHAAQILPKHSGILVFSNRYSADENLAQLAFQTVRSKNIRVYIVWGNSRFSASRLLKDISKYSGGSFFVTPEKNVSNYRYNLFLENDNLDQNVSVILSKKNLRGDRRLTFPIDTDVTGIHIYIKPDSTQGNITTPNGDYFRISSVEEFSAGSFSIAENGLRQIHLSVTTPRTQSVGLWQLQLRNIDSYDVTVFVFTKITVDAYISYEKKNNESEEVTKNAKEIVKLGVNGDVSVISDISFVDTNGKLIFSNNDYAPHHWQKYVTETLDKNDKQNKELIIEIDGKITSPSFALIKGNDSNGHAFERLSYVYTYNPNNIFPKQPLKIEVGLGSELITTGGKRTQLFFDVSNLGNQALDVRFTCSDTKYLLQYMTPYRRLLSPLESTVVTVTIVTKYGTYQDEVTFSAISGTESVSQKVIVDVGTTTSYDTTEPELSHKYTSDCTDVILRNCQDGTWTLEIKAKDTGSGLLQVTSVPKGIYYPYGFTAGTKEEVTGYFSDSCCNPDIQISAVDRVNNRRTYNLNAYLAIWSAGAISAIVLGILFLILIIALIVYLIVRWRKKQETYNLPTYRGGGI